jgi:hypothetical protein
MPIEPSKLQQIIDSVEQYLMENKDKILAAYKDGKDCSDILNPLNAPPRTPFAADSPPSHIHGQPKCDLF